MISPLEQLIQELRLVKTKLDRNHQVTDDTTKDFRNHLDELSRENQSLNTRKSMLQEILLKHAELGDDILMLRLQYEERPINPYGAITTSVGQPFQAAMQAATHATMQASGQYYGNLMNQYGSNNPLLPVNTAKKI